MNAPLEAKFDLANNVIKELHHLVNLHDISYIDAIIHYAEIAKIELEVLAEIAQNDPLIYSKIELEAENLNFLNKKARLPLE